MIDTVIFDLEGVIIDSEPLWTKADVKFLKSNGIEITAKYSESCLKPKLMGRALTDGADYLKRKYGLQGSVEGLAQERRECFRSLLGKQVSFMPGFAKFYRTLGNYRTAIATSLERQFFNAIDKKLALGKLFGGNVFSIEDIGFVSKPNPAIFLYAAKMLESKPQNCLVIEDSPNGILAAKRARMKCIALTTTTRKDVLSRAHPDLIAGSFPEVSRFIRGRT